METPTPPKKILAAKAQRIPRISYDVKLPITGRKDDIIRSIRDHQVTILTGETGSGKTTQLPKMCLEAGRGRTGLIGCTQPRRVAAVTVATRLAEELGEDIGSTVAYKIRFDEKTGPKPLIKIMTDGILLIEAQSDRLLRRYDTIIVDEAHERSLNIDFVLGILKLILPKRPDLKIIITSATLDTEKFSTAFNKAPIIEVSGRMYPVDVKWQPMDPDLEESGEFTYIDAAVDAATSILDRRERGDMLIFMPTEQDIWETCESLEGRHGKDAVILPLFARLPWHEQKKVFQSAALSKIIVATNVAETSLTIPNIRYVIDTGLARISYYNARTRTASLPIRPISRSSADQRMGRCGRVRHGICIRLYSEDDYLTRPLYTPPEILRSNLAGVILQMLLLKLGDIFDFPFIDQPQRKNIADALDILQELGTIQKPIRRDLRENGPQPFVLTEQGRAMARLPIDPRVSRIILEGSRRGCLDEAAVIAAALSIVDPRERPQDKKAQSDQMHAPFKDLTSDFMTLLRIWTKFHTNLDNLKTQSKMRKFCHDHFLSYKRMREWRDIYKQITQIIEEGPQDIASRETSAQPTEDMNTAIHKSILSGFLGNIAQKKEKNLYYGAKGREPMIFPGSALFNHGGPWIVAAEMVETSRLYARIAANIEPDWIEEIGKVFCRSTYSDPHWEKNREDVVASEKVTLFGLTIIPKRSVSFSRINPEEASALFIRQGLIPGELKSALAFLRHNLALVKRLQDMENKTRHHDVIDEEAIFQFYATRLPAIANVSGLKKLIHKRGSDLFLRMTEEDIILQSPDHEILATYPDQALVDGVPLRLSYRFEPGKIHDGVTMTIPSALLPDLSPNDLDWAVPGILKDKIHGLLKGLPKEYRKKLPPLPSLCDLVLKEMKRGDNSLLTNMGRFIHDRFGISIPAAAWPTDQLPDHLRMRLEVIDEKAHVLSASRDISALQKTILTGEESSAFETARRLWEREGFTSWDVDEIPESIPLKAGNITAGYAFPALEAHEGGVRLHLFKNRSDALRHHRAGVLRLYEILYQEDLRHLKKALAITGNWKIWAPAFGGVKAIEKRLYEKVMEDLFSASVRTRTDFERHGGESRKKMLIRATEIIRLAAPVVEAYAGTVAVLDRLEKANAKSVTVRQFISDLRRELSSLVPIPFLQIYTEDRLNDVIRYLRALTIRAERGLVHLEKDAIKWAEVKVYVDKLKDIRSEVHDGSSPDRKEAVEALAWMIEEFKVSIFAQELKTPYPISKKRLNEKITDIEMME